MGLIVVKYYLEPGATVVPSFLSKLEEVMGGKITTARIYTKGLNDSMDINEPENWFDICSGYGIDCKEVEQLHFRIHKLGEASLEFTESGMVHYEIIIGQWYLIAAIQKAFWLLKAKSVSPSGEIGEIWEPNEKIKSLKPFNSYNLFEKAKLKYWGL